MQTQIKHISSGYLWHIDFVQEMDDKSRKVVVDGQEIGYIMWHDGTFKMQFSQQREAYVPSLTMLPMEMLFQIMAKYYEWREERDAQRQNSVPAGT